jgi:hypothetical protein
MRSVKRFRLETCDGRALEADIVERYEAESLVHTWECSLLLSAYLMTMPSASFFSFIISSSQLIRSQSILEIGAGTGLPSIISAKLNASKVVASERADEDFLLKNLEQIGILNALENFSVVSRLSLVVLVDLVCQMPLSWDDPSTWPCTGSDLILGADVFYSTEGSGSLPPFHAHSNFGSRFPLSLLAPRPSAETQPFRPLPHVVQDTQVSLHPPPVSSLTALAGHWSHTLTSMGSQHFSSPPPLSFTRATPPMSTRGRIG